MECSVLASQKGQNIPLQTASMFWERVHQKLSLQKTFMSEICLGICFGFSIRIFSRSAAAALSRVQNEAPKFDRWKFLGAKNKLLVPDLSIMELPDSISRRSRDRVFLKHFLREIRALRNVACASACRPINIPRNMAHARSIREMTSRSHFPIKAVNSGEPFLGFLTSSHRPSACRHITGLQNR